jgi:hypothetical protein
MKKTTADRRVKEESKNVQPFDKIWSPANIRGHLDYQQT